MTNQSRNKACSFPRFIFERGDKLHTSRFDTLKPPHSLYRYKLGIDSYLNVITAQTTYLVNRETLTTLRTQQMTANVQLVEAIGGGWNASQLPAPRQLLSRSRKMQQ